MKLGTLARFGYSAVMKQQHHLAAFLSSSSANAPSTLLPEHYNDAQSVDGSPQPCDTGLQRAAAWSVPNAAAVDAAQTNDHLVEVSRTVLPRSDRTWLRQQQQQQQQPKVAEPAPPMGDLRLVDFMERVKLELWEFNSMPLRRRFRVQSLLRRLHTPPLASWSNALARATEECPRPFTRTLLARYEAESSPSSLPAHLDTGAPAFDLLLLCWRPGAESVIHDHPDAGCWVKVLKGELKETRYGLVHAGSSSSSSSSLVHSDEGNGRGGGLVKTSSITCNPGTVTYIEDSMGYHKMENPSPTEETISLHLYSPGIPECTTWADASCFGTKASMRVDDNFVTQKQKFGLL